MHEINEIDPVVLSGVSHFTIPGGMVRVVVEVSRQGRAAGLFEDNSDGAIIHKVGKIIARDAILPMTPRAGETWRFRFTGAPRDQGVRID